MIAPMLRMLVIALLLVAIAPAFARAEIPKKIADTIRAIYEDPHWQEGFGVVWDGSGVTELLFDRGDVAGLIEVQRSFSGRAGSGRDVIITHRPLDEAVAKTYILLAKDARPTMLAKSRWEALTALGGRV